MAEQDGNTDERLRGYQREMLNHALKGNAIVVVRSYRPRRGSLFR